MIRAVVVAFDGPFAATLEARCIALSDALATHDVRTARSPDPSDLAGVTFAECARGLGVEDETVVDLVSLTAERAFEAQGAGGWPVDPALLLVLRDHGAAGRRLVLRADSSRRLVERALSLAGVAELFSLVRCSDDLPRAAAASSLESSWTAIDRRLTAFGVTPQQRLALEPAPARAVAARFARTDPHARSVDTPRFPG